MARISVEQKALTDPRFHILGSKAGAGHDHAQAIGLFGMIRLWHECIERGTEAVHMAMAEAVFGHLDAAQWIVEAELGEWIDDRYIRIKGASGRLDYLERIRERNQAGGKARAATAKRDKKTGAFIGTSTRCTSQSPAKGGSKLPAYSSALTLTLTPDQIPDSSTSPPNIPPRGDLAGSGRRTGDTYSKDFLQFWQAYPRKVGKRAAWIAWKRLKLNGQAGDLIRAVRVQASSDQWTRDGGQYVPHPATWLNQGRWEDQVSNEGGEPDEWI